MRWARIAMFASAVVVTYVSSAAYLADTERPLYKAVSSIVPDRPLLSERINSGRNGHNVYPKTSGPYFHRPAMSEKVFVGDEEGFLMDERHNEVKQGTVDSRNCKIVRYNKPLPPKLQEHQFAKRLKLYIHNINRMLKESDVCFRLIYEGFINTYTEYTDRWPECSISYVRFVVPQHRISTHDMPFQRPDSTMAHAFWGGDVHVNLNVVWSLDGVGETFGGGPLSISKHRKESSRDRDEDSPSETEFAGEELNFKQSQPETTNYFKLMNTVPHELLHTIGIMHVNNEKAIMFRLYTNFNDIETARLQPEEVIQFHRMYGKRTSFTCDL